MPRIGIVITSALGACALFAATECLLTASAAPQSGPGAATQGRSVWDGVYTAEQAAKGKETYDLYCSSCHGNDLGGIDGPTLVGNDFLRNWMEDNLNALVQKIHKRMPADAPGSLPMESVAEITAFLLRSNAFPSGTQPLLTHGRPL